MDYMYTARVQSASVVYAELLLNTDYVKTS